MAIDCGHSEYVYGRDRDRVQRDVDTMLCTTEAQCKDDDVKRTCVRRTFVGPSKEDPTFYIGFVMCICPKDLPKPKKSRKLSSD